MKRRINSKAIRRFIEDKGDLAKTQLSLDAKVSVSMIEKLMIGTYPAIPRLATRERICEAMGLSEDEIFPLTQAKGNSKSAS